MTALAQERMTEFAGVVPSRGTFSIKANVRIFKGALVAIDSAGRAMPAGLLAAGALSAVGKASATYDNRTGSVLGGAADACDVEVEFGVFDYASATGGGDDIAADDVGKLAYMQDDQTVALTNASGTRGPAGVVTEVRDDKVYIFTGPHVVSAVAAQPLMPVYTNATRPAATAFQVSSQIWNSDDNAPNFSDGTNWRDASGSIT